MFFFNPFDTLLTGVSALGGCDGRAFLLQWELPLISFVFAVLPYDEWDSIEDEEAFDSFWVSCSIILGIGFDECVDSENDTDCFLMFCFFFFIIAFEELFDCE